LYGGRDGPVARAVALTHRREPVFHTIMAGAGKEHNSLGMIILYAIEPELRESLRSSHPDVTDVCVVFEPPKMGMTGEVRVQLRRGSTVDGEALVRHVLGLRAGGYDLARVLRKVVLVDDDVDVSRSADVTWAINNRALSTDRFIFIDDLPLPGVGLRRGIDTRVAEADYEALQRLVIPGSEAVLLDDYLD
ncbi:MAG: UbiD family decarboxylase, partial [Gammaproteobacteria bacterium]|nr:UbiD family decarboxylase [Gammaproteobacteria bacterium]